MPRTPITLDSILEADRDCVACDLAGDAVILSLRDGVYYGLDPVGAAVWRMLERPCSAAALRDALVAEFEVDPGRCALDLLALLEDLATHSLLEVRHGQPA